MIKKLGAAHDIPTPRRKVPPKAYTPCNLFLFKEPNEVLRSWAASIVSLLPINYYSRTRSGTATEFVQKS